MLWKVIHIDPVLGKVPVIESSGRRDEHGSEGEEPDAEEEARLAPEARRGIAAQHLGHRVA